MNRITPIILLISLSLTYYGCRKEKTTKELLQGNWQLIQVTDEKGNTVEPVLDFPVSAIQITEDNLTGTHGPIFMYIANGDNNWINAESKFKEVFDYTNFQYSTSSFIIQEATPERYENLTIAYKLKATSPTGSLPDLLSVLGIKNEWLQPEIFLEFKNINFLWVSGPHGTKSQTDYMTWEVDDLTTASYSYYNNQGSLVSWGGWQASNLTKRKFTFKRTTEGIDEIVKAKI